MIPDLHRIFKAVHHDTAQLSVPSNLLLFGEYAVTKIGGHGIWLSPECRASAQINPCHKHRITIHGRFGASPYFRQIEIDAQGAPNWQAIGEGLGANDLLSAVLLAMRPYITRLGISCLFQARNITLDTRALYYTDGRKRGYGSSAAACVLLGAALAGSLVDPRLALLLQENDFRQIVIDAHRLFQGGRGSGYDVVASLYGASGLFIGGPQPQVRPLPSPYMVYAIARGNAPIGSAGAVHAYQQWSEHKPQAAIDYEQNYQTLCLRWVELCTGPKASEPLPIANAILAEARQLGVNLGQAIGIDARMDDGIKALGAGNEIGIKFFPACDNACPDIDDLELMIPSNEGLRLEQVL